MESIFDAKIYGDFEGFPENNSAVFGLVSYNFMGI